MDGIFFLIPLVAVLAMLGQSHGQYGTDDYDIVRGAQMGECTFYGDHTVDCSGRLRCHASDVADRADARTLDRTCPRESGDKSGTWNRDQVIPSNMMGSGSGRIAKCQFHAKSGNGNFQCTGTQGDTWKGVYTGTLNTAFRLGLPVTAGYGGGTGSNYGNRATADDDTSYYTTPRYPSYGRDTTYSYGRDRDSYGSGGRNSYATGVNLGDRDTSYGGRDTGRNNYQTTYRGANTYDSDRESRYPAAATTSEITMCTYTNDGKGKCRDCSERVDRKETDREIRTTKHYTCRGAETPTTWTEDNGIIPQGQRPDPYTSRKSIIATCIYRPDERTFECHGGSNDGSCNLGNDGYGTSGSSSYGSRDASRCLTGEKWTGTYRGSIY